MTVRRLLSQPQFRVLKHLDTHGEIRLALDADRRPARMLEALGCVEHVEEFTYRITDHGRNILEMQRPFFEEAN